MGVGQTVRVKPVKKSDSVVISSSEYAFYQKLKKYFEEMRTTMNAQEIRKDIEEAKETGKTYKNLNDLLRDAFAE
jgi:hypothetical protein